jgi:replication-associated recombination protein RarA
MNQLVLHPLTAQQVDNFVGNPLHALLLVGPRGSGKNSLARDVAEKVLELQPGDSESYSYLKVIEPVDGKAIGIEAVREIEHFLSLKVPSQAVINRAILIQDSHLLTIEAQNALLKTLEEPPIGTLIILTATSQQELLPTITSRAAILQVRHPEKTALEKHFSAENVDPATLERAYIISGGLPGLMTAIMQSTDHPLLEATERARDLLKRSSFERLLAVDEFVKQKQLARDTCFILQQMAHISLQTATGTTADRWQRVLKAAYEADEALVGSAQPKLLLTNLMLQL